MTALLKLLDLTITRLVFVALTWLCLKLKIGAGEAEINSAATWVAGGAVIVAGLLVEWLWLKLKARFAKKEPDAPAPVAKIGPILLLACLLPLAGCASNLTPQQRYDIYYGSYAVANGIATGVNAAGKIPADQVVPLQKDFATVADHLTKASIWLEANPELRDIVGIYVPELDAVKISLAVARNHVRKFVLFAPMPGASLVIPPATQPTTRAQ